MIGVEYGIALVGEKIPCTRYIALTGQHSIMATSTYTDCLSFYEKINSDAKIAYIIGKSVDELSSHYGTLNNMKNFQPIEIGVPNENGLTISAIGCSYFGLKH